MSSVSWFECDCGQKDEDYPPANKSCPRCGDLWHLHVFYTPQSLHYIDGELVAYQGRTLSKEEAGKIEAEFAALAMRT